MPFLSCIITCIIFSIIFRTTQELFHVWNIFIFHFFTFLKNKITQNSNRKMWTSTVCPSVRPSVRMSVCNCPVIDSSSLFSLFCLLVSSLYAVQTNYLFLAVIIAHTYIAFPTPIVYFAIFVTWADLTPLSLWLALSASFLWLGCGFCHPTPFHCFNNRGLQLGASFQSTSHVWCDKLLWQLFEEEPSCIGDAALEFWVLSREKGVGIQGGNVNYVVPQHHWPPLCLALAGVGANHLVSGVYTSFRLVVKCDYFCFFYFCYFHPLLCCGASCSGAQQLFLSFWHSWPW